MHRGGELIRQARLRTGLTQNELARRLGTSQSVIARWETGRRSPTLETVWKAVRACGMELDISITNYDFEHDVLIEQNLRLSPADRLEQMVTARAAIEELVETARRGK
ncbi:MAG TPA: helix-turn-helix transcriptional regulator [Actinomycetota bacterium]|nr:helix-turn-helix transcriptional regulator [Actinomycetota bacterium]